MVLRESPYWWDGLGEAPLPPSPLPESADVVVVGSGYTGLSAALRLAKGGARVAVLERETVGFGASSRNGGQVLTGLKVGPATLLERFGREKARELFRSSIRAIESLEDLLGNEGIACGYERCGHIEAAFKPAHFERFQRDRDLLASVFDHHVETIPRAAQGSELGSDFYHGLLLDPRSGALQPARFVGGLARAAAREGAILCERSPVLGIVREDGAFRVETPAGRVRARDVLVATNGYTDLVPFRSRVVPVGSYIIATEALPPETAERLLPRRRVVFDSKHFIFYFRLMPDGRLLFGGRAQWTPSSPDTTRRSAGILREALARVFPALRDVAVDYAWSGNVCFTPDLLPRSGCLDGVHYAMGYGGHGVAMATYLGTLAAERLLRGEDRSPFRGFRFGAIPLYSGRPWFLPLVGAYYKGCDLLQ
jgi:glycine/D-amino acid oxidase-like deaminating enzyme